MIEQVENVTVKELASDLLKISLRNLGDSYSVDIDMAISRQIEEEFNRCLRSAIFTFIKHLAQEKTNFSFEILTVYLRSSVVAGEIWHLLDPGSEVFDKGLLANYAD